jgi:hypothetical protein
MSRATGKRECVNKLPPRPKHCQAAYPSAPDVEWPRRGGQHQAGACDTRDGPCFLIGIEWHANAGFTPRFGVPRYGADIRRAKAPMPSAGRRGGHPLWAWAGGHGRLTPRHACVHRPAPWEAANDSQHERAWRAHRAAMGEGERGQDHGASIVGQAPGTAAIPCCAQGGAPRCRPGALLVWHRYCTSRLERRR